MATLPTPALQIDPATRWALAVQYSDENNVTFCDALRIVAAGSDRALVVANIGDTYSELAKNGAGEWVWVERVEAADDEADDDGYYETKRFLATCAL
ncbi:hypothetical protein FAES_1799 [Fibrella aestuarina BUZ 2]|uniref:Uncharacterized protein n=1 Tax=Fibrella aestuarina BUZ 2 TaxID=1166018 RepID=I0K6Q6_9BACT|nr:hypothetical protein [Fibrella aestuarina]CCG99809.1 hypothetical protein FAES_1799 [Fibrella aestuarina BUZ 2]